MDYEFERIKFLQSLVNVGGFGLEIGPSYNPVVTKASGARVDILDHASTEQIRAKYRGVPTVDANRIEEVDFVMDGRSMREVVGKHAAYDYIIASHVIEHMPDMVSFLQDCEWLLKPNGRLLLAVPDKRRCFDVYRPTSSTGDVLQAFLERRKRHTPGKGFDHVSSIASLTPEGERVLAHSLTDAYSLFTAMQSSNDYHDVHAWQYTPSSFRLILQDLNALGVLELREAEFHDTVGLEFYSVLSRVGAGSQLPRPELLERSLDELRAPTIFGTRASFL